MIERPKDVGVSRNKDTKEVNYYSWNGIEYETLLGLIQSVYYKGVADA